jgi:hypothetical protein
LKEQEKTTGNLADEDTVMDEQKQELHNTLLFQSDLVRLVNALTALETGDVQEVVGISTTDESSSRQESVTL